jgi:hypothetical protein
MTALWIANRQRLRIRRKCAVVAADENPQCKQIGHQQHCNNNKANTFSLFAWTIVLCSILLSIRVSTLGTAIVQNHRYVSTQSTVSQIHSQVAFVGIIHVLVGVPALSHSPGKRLCSSYTKCAVLPGAVAFVSYAPTKVFRMHQVHVLSNVLPFGSSSELSIWIFSEHRSCAARNHLHT